MSLSAKATATVSQPEKPTIAFKFAVVKQVTRQQIKMIEDTAYYFRFQSDIYREEDINPTRKRKVKDGAETADKPMEAPWLMDVTEHTSGEIGKIIVPSVLKTELEDAYPVLEEGGKPGFIGRDFEVIPHKKAGKRYWVFDIQEIAIEDSPLDAKEAAQAETAAKKNAKKAAA
jgi:hypothetical protein